MKKILIVMGSDSDYPVLQNAFKILKQFNIEYTAVVCSAHRTPEEAARIASTAIKEGFKVIIAAAGLAAHLPGVIAAYTVLPVIGLPISGAPLSGKDALYSIVQMPSGVPVATVAIDGSTNAAILAIQILAINDAALTEKLIKYKDDLKNSVAEKNKALNKKMNDAGL